MMVVYRKRTIWSSSTFTGEPGIELDLSTRSTERRMSWRLELIRNWWYRCVLSALNWYEITANRRRLNPILSRHDVTKTDHFYFVFWNIGLHKTRRKEQSINASKNPVLFHTSTACCDTTTAVTTTTVCYYYRFTAIKPGTTVNKWTICWSKGLLPACPCWR